MSKKQDEELLRLYFELERQIEALDEEWSYKRKRLCQYGQQYIDMTWHLFYYDELKIKEDFDYLYNTLQSQLSSNQLELQDISGLVRIRDLNNRQLDNYKDVTYYINNIIMNENHLRLKDENSYETLSSTMIFNDYKALDALLESSQAFIGYISTLSEEQKNRLQIEMNLMIRIVDNEFNIIESEYQSLYGKIMKDFNRISQSYELMLLLTK